MTTAGSPTNEVEIVDVVKVPALSPERLGEVDLIVRYRLPNGQTQEVRVTNENATEAEIEAAVRKDAQRFIRILGKKIRV